MNCGNFFVFHPYNFIPGYVIICIKHEFPYREYYIFTCINKNQRTRQCPTLY
jgi:hypothetical protein